MIFLVSWSKCARTMFIFRELMLFDSMNISKSLIHCLTSVLFGSNLSGGETNNIVYGLIVSVERLSSCELRVSGSVNLTCLLGSTKVLSSSSLGAEGYISVLNSLLG